MAYLGPQLWDFLKRFVTLGFSQLVLISLSVCGSWLITSDLAKQNDRLNWTTNWLLNFFNSTEPEKPYFKSVFPKLYKNTQFFRNNMFSPVGWGYRIHRLYLTSPGDNTPRVTNYTDTCPPPITKTIQVRRTRHAGHCWRSKDELISDVLLWSPTYGCPKAGRPARTYIQQLCEDTGCNPEDLSEAMNDREKWRERVRDIRAGGTTWWWWW